MAIGDEPKPENKKLDKKVEQREVTNKTFIFRKGDAAVGTEDTCEYPLSEGGRTVPKNLVPKLDFNAEQTLQRDGIVIVDEKGKPHHNWEDTDPE